MILVRAKAMALCVTLLAAPAVAGERAQLALCPGPHAAAMTVKILRVAGEGTLLLRPKAEARIGPCRLHDTTIPIERVRWLGAVATEQFKTSRRVSLVSREDTGQITGLELEHDRSRAPAPDRPARAKQERAMEVAAWVWEPEAWLSHGDALIEWARRQRFGKILLTIRVDNGRVTRSHDLAEFIVRARGNDLSVIAAEGDPDMISTAGLEHALSRASALAAYQQAHPQARLAGFQYDIEPYVAQGFAADPASAWRLWAHALAHLSAALDTRVDVVVPFWLLESAGGESALDAAAAVLDRITIMAYRTDTSAILTAASPLLDWASSRGLPVVVALETGALPPERHERFVPAEAGELHVITLGDVAAAILLDSPQPAAPGTAVFRRAFAVTANPGRVTFAGRPDRLRDTLADLARDLAAWPAARGIALHGLDWRGSNHRTNGGTP